ncbi:S8 family serine peptidase [Olleya sp. HaHaR_3_96]|uniref:S8 family serine peptidase n=1 Tax=Olleya sp. HaHaR_3_96 TaxID=2745560 RepID=UPI001C4E3D9B|nr:S8 family serine peptidase [Olleya sp. HaHaR_3_96]QXP60790.1 S8 family serine peptidase [Olleya sp. HaHaR_3_96]
MNKIYILLIPFFFTQCKENNFTRVSIQEKVNPSIELSEKKFRNWHHKDIIDDSIPGTSLDKAYDLILKDKEGKEIIVALIDTSIDINHEDLSSSIWTNSNEVPNNNIDDDDNGYIDDLHGWNFIGNKKGENTLFVNYEITRILKKYNSSFLNNEIKDSLLYRTYKTAKKRYAERFLSAKDDSIYINNVANWKNESRVFLSSYFKDSNYTIKQLDSLKQVHGTDSILQFNAVRMSNFIKYAPDEKIKISTIQANERLVKLLNTSYNDRIIINDNPEDLSDTNYGNNIVNQDLYFLEHGTFMVGLIGAKRNNEIGIDGFSNNIQIMALSISSNGDEHDKDIALAIRYAVDNGAKVINMSIGKEFSLYKEWVFEALKYAEEKDVLVVSGAGNSSYNLNIFNDYYPNDNINNGKEVSDNFIKVGASTYEPNENLFAVFSNYGNIDIDVFAPGTKIYTTTPAEEKYKFVSGGTSASCAITTGVAALVRSYYPSLTASQVKHIIMDSGVEYTFPVKLTKNDTIKTPFNQLSKSGKIVNAYNALIVADSISKK